jgi:hypothetical protein
MGVAGCGHSKPHGAQTISCRVFLILAHVCLNRGYSFCCRNSRKQLMRCASCVLR